MILDHPHHQSGEEEGGLRRNYAAHFPWKRYPKMRPVQEEALRCLPQGNRGIRVFELPTGSGKTAIGMTFLKALAAEGRGPLFYITPTKAQVEQIKKLHPEVKAVYGRNEYDCLYYEPEQPFRADQIPCSLLIDCEHRVDQMSGELFGGNPLLAACPYLQEKFVAKQGGIIVCTTAFYLFTALFNREWGDPAGLVIDEAHQVAQTVRQALSYEITDWHLGQLVDALRDVDARIAAKLERLQQEMVRIIRTKPASQQTLLEEDEISELIGLISRIEPDGELTTRLKERVDRKVARGQLERAEGVATLKQMETIVRDLGRYLRSLQYALPEEGGRNALNYCFATYLKERDPAKHVQYRLIVKSHYVAPLVRRFLAPFTLAMSATIGDAGVLEFETGIRGPFYSFGSDFPHEKTRIFLATDAPDLSWNAQRANRGGNLLNRSLRQIVRACRRFAEADIRSLVIVTSDAERVKFAKFAHEEGIEAITYDATFSARAAAGLFKEGNGHVLVGTKANYGEGLDLPRGLAPVIFFLRPSYPPPHDPATIFEDRRFGRQRWKVWNWRVMIEALQARGRNIRSRTDQGVTFFVSRQFGRFVAGSLPEWLRPAYRNELTFEECVAETLGLLTK